MTPKPSPLRQRPSVLLTVLRVVVILAGLILVARLVPVAIRAIGGAGRGGLGAIGGLGPLGWILAILLAAGAVVSVVKLVRRRGRTGKRPPPATPLN
jgi:hypothetical protein